MKLTPEQQERVRQAKASGERRVMLEPTPEQRSEWRAALEHELASKNENISHIRKIVAAAEQPGIFGDIRRAILVSRYPIAELAAVIEVEQDVLSDFRAAEADLPAAALDRLVEALGLRLMQEIPR